MQPMRPPRTPQAWGGALPPMQEGRATALQHLLTVQCPPSNGGPPRGARDPTVAPQTTDAGP